MVTIEGSHSAYMLEPTHLVYWVVREPLCICGIGDTACIGLCPHQPDAWDELSPTMLRSAQIWGKLFDLFWPPTGRSPVLRRGDKRPCGVVQ
jgi:hypothetical protein